MDPKVCATLHVFHALTPYLHFGEEARRQPGIHGKCFLKLLQHLKTYYSCKVTSEAPLHQLWNGSWFWCMTALVTSRKLMRPGNTYLHTSQGPWKTFHQHWQHWYSILKGCATSITVGTRPWYLTQVQQIGDEERPNWMATSMDHTSRSISHALN